VTLARTATTTAEKTQKRQQRLANRGTGRRV
jgi:hypothetical protein